MTYKDIIEIEARFHDILKGHLGNEGYGRLAKFLGLDEAMGSLEAKERDVLSARWGLDGYGSRSLEEVGKTYGVTRERIRSIEANAIKKLKNFNLIPKVK